jgi:excisionase family DNA binding protein
VEDAVREHLGDDGLVVGRASLKESVPDVLTLDEAAALLRVDTVTLQTEIERGGIPARQIGTEWRFSGNGLIDWLEHKSDQ